MHLGCSKLWVDYSEGWTVSTFKEVLVCLNKVYQEFQIHLMIISRVSLTSLKPSGACLAIDDDTGTSSIYLLCSGFFPYKAPCYMHGYIIYGALEGTIKSCLAETRLRSLSIRRSFRRRADFQLRTPLKTTRNIGSKVSWSYVTTIGPRTYGHTGLRYSVVAK